MVPLAIFAQEGPGVAAPQSPYAALQAELARAIEAAEGDSAALKRIYADFAARFAAFAESSTGEAAEMAAIDAAVYFEFGGDRNRAIRALTAAREQASTWKTRLLLARAAGAIGGAEPVAAKVARELAEEAVADPQRARALARFMDEIGLTPDAVRLLERALATLGDDHPARPELDLLARSLKLEPGVEALPFEAEPVGGGSPITLKSLRGRVVVLHFWAVGDETSRAGLARLESLRVSLGREGLALVGVALDEDVEALTAFLRVNPLAWPQVAEGRGWDSALAELYNVRAVPTFFIIDRRGRVAAFGRRLELLEASLRRALAESVPQP